MNKNDNRTKEKLIKAVLDLLTVKSGHLLTIREIAKKADVNSAAISYYFGSKEILISEASQFYWGQWENILTELRCNNQSPVKRLKEYLYSYLNYLLKYDGIFKNYIAKVISESEYDLQTSENIIKLSNAILQCIKEYTKIEDKQILKFKTIAVLSSIAYPALLGNYGTNSLELDICDDELKKKYINELVGSILRVHEEGEGK